tara:strand:- start:1403 stop:1630 length:228 start_codon:yes stop_codon:yes gene_type:complete
MSRVFNSYYFAKLDVKNALEKAGLLTGLLNEVYKEQGLDTIGYIVRKNIQGGLTMWFNDDMMKDIIKEVKHGEDV